MGDPYAAIELHGNVEDLVQLESLPAAVELDARAWQLAARVVDAGIDDDTLLVERSTALITHLSQLGLVSPSAHAAAMKPAPRMYRTLWKALRPMIEGFSTSARLKEVSSETGLSERQAARNVGSFFGAFSFWARGWRPSLGYLRLRFAVLLLSAEHATIQEVAQAVGYGSTSAMDRAFRNGGIPSPGDVQQLLRASA
jgi:AraC-like DNA-binding protein